MRNTFEYITIPNANIDKMNKAGSQGWELVSVVGATDGMGGFTCFFKRALELAFDPAHPVMQALRSSKV